METETFIFPNLERETTRIISRHVENLLHPDDGIKAGLRRRDVKENSIGKPEARNIAPRELVKAIKPIAESRAITF